MTTKKPKNRGALILFYAESEQPGWEGRKNPLGSLTNYLDEHQNRQNNPQIPQPGYRFPQFKKAPTADENRRLEVKEGDWVVTRVNRYFGESEDCEWGETIICYCKYEPIAGEWERVPTWEEVVSR